MCTSAYRSVRYEAARFAWLRELQAMLELTTGSPEWERQWLFARRLEQHYQIAKFEFLQQGAED
jgi:hypothetical protein